MANAVEAVAMANEQDTKAPPFETVVAAPDFLSEAEIDRLIAEHEPLLKEGKLGAGATNASVRRSRIAFLGMEPRDRLGLTSASGSRRSNAIAVFSPSISLRLRRTCSLPCYDSSDRGFYDWHTDFAGFRPLRKLSFSVQLSRSEDYEGGDLQLWVGNRPRPAVRDRGALIAFPSFTLHRVAPVTRGTRWSLVAWILGNRWR